jgi:hypothetical protein
MIAKTAANGAFTLEQKPLHIIWLRRAKRIHGALVLVPKRGGALKALLLSATSHRRSLSKLIKAGEDYARETGQKKLYYIHPIDDALMVGLLRAKGYLAEGILREPYQIGRDNLVLSRGLKPG